MTTVLNRPGTLRRHASGLPRSLRIVICWACAIVAPSGLGQASAADNGSLPAAATCQILVTFSTDFGRANADATCEILDRELGGGDRAGKMNGNWIVFLALLTLPLLVLLTGIVRWFADSLRFHKYDARRGNSQRARVRPTWWLGRGCLLGLSIAGAFVLLSLIESVTGRSGPTVAGLRVVVVGPREVAHNAGPSRLAQVPYDTEIEDLGDRVVQLLERYGVSPVRRGGQDAKGEATSGGIRRLELYLNTPPNFDMYVRHHPQVQVDRVLDGLATGIPRVTVRSCREDVDVDRCEIRHAQSNPLARIAAERASSALGEYGVPTRIVGQPQSDALTRISLNIPLSGMSPPRRERLVVYHLPAQNLQRLATRLNDQGIHVELRAVASSPVAPGILYYPALPADNKLDARRRAMDLLQLIQDEGFLGATANIPAVPAVRDDEGPYEISLLPLGKPGPVNVHCDQPFFGKLRPSLVQTFAGGRYAFEIVCAAIDGNPKSPPGVIRYAHETDRYHAERLRAVLTEIVGLVHVRVASQEEPQLDGLVVSLTYATNGEFHEFVDDLLKTLRFSDRKDVPEFFAPQITQQDQITHDEHALECRKVVPLREQRPENDWRDRFVQPWVVRLNTLRLQKENVGDFYTVIRADRILVCERTDTGIKITAVPERYAVDMIVFDKFDVVLTGGEATVGKALSEFDPSIRKAPSPEGAQAETIYYQQDLPEAHAVAVMAQAILEESGFIYLIEARTLPKGDHVHVVAVTTQEVPVDGS